jgi:hypothetical protein
MFHPSRVHWNFSLAPRGAHLVTFALRVAPTAARPLIATLRALTALAWADTTRATEVWVTLDRPGALTRMRTASFLPASAERIR